MGGSTFAIGLVPGYETLVLPRRSLFYYYDYCKDWHWAVNMGVRQHMLPNMHRATEEDFLLPGYKPLQHLVYFFHLGIILITRHSLDMTGLISIAKFNDWGWRIPFLVSIILVIVSVYIRLKMKESPLYAKLKTEGKTSVNPLKESFAHKSNLKMVLLALFGATMGQGVVWYTGQFYAQSFIENVCKVDFEQSRTILIWAILFATPFFVVFGLER